ncbi:RNA-binding cell elongation regulator Jag/EloR [Isobaculum melis]|uniref:RNA-binding protein KhpB n=1 Tax=Isobaculum melis TaxID=142588 RepID=A0A1H9U5M7_9LACT|nr:RNA-binding cell elongation regulator Jag/EloR [Isobaculum melis]SES04785.1 spoIIIJ-associated protein [Isobaculum melis]
MNTFTAQAPTVEEATNQGLQTLGIDKNDAIIDILEEGKKGLFGIGKKAAIVKVTKKISEAPVQEENVAAEAIVTQATEAVAQQSEKNESTVAPTERDDEAAIKEVALYLTQVTEQMNATALVHIERKETHIIFHLDTSKGGLLIGKHGRTLNALQYLAQVLLHRHAENKLTAVVNVGDYRERREASLHRLAEQTASKVSRTRQPVFLEPMPAFERKIVHSYLSEDGRVETHSEGKDPHRYLVVESSNRY